MASFLTASSFKATALNNTIGKTVETSRASKTESIEVSFTLDENMLAEEGEKDIYIQILTPENNVFADKGAVTFGELSLIYSTKKIIAYNNGALDVSIVVTADDDERPLVEGNYYISVFNNDRKLGGTELQLDYVITSYSIHYTKLYESAVTTIETSNAPLLYAIIFLVL